MLGAKPDFNGMSIALYQSKTSKKWVLIIFLIEHLACENPPKQGHGH